VLNNDRTIIANLKPGETANVAAGASMVIRVDVSTETPLTDLIFTWSICSQPGRFSEGTSLIEIPYQAPNSPIIDCVRVMIRKGETIITNYTQISVKVN
jgi:hypothetical protein